MDFSDDTTPSQREQAALPPLPSSFVRGKCAMPHLGRDPGVPVTAYHVREGMLLCDECAYSHDMVGEFGEAA